MTNDLKPTFEHYYPTGTKGPGSGNLAGECAMFTETVVTFHTPVGDTIISKTAAVKKYGLPPQTTYLPGDVLVLDVGTAAGHMAVVNCNVNGKPRVSESNWHLDKKMTHDRIINNLSQIVGIFRGPLKVAVINPMEIIKIKIVDNVKWPDMAAQVQQFADMVQQWSANRLSVSCETIPSNYDESQIPLETYAEIFKGPTHVWLHANLDQFKADGDIIIFNEHPQPQVAEQGYCLDPDVAGGVFYLIITTAEMPLFKQDYGYTEFTKLALHELSHMLYHVTGGVDQTHFYDYTSGHTLAEAYQNLDYGALSTNLALRRAQRETQRMLVFFQVKNTSTIWLLADGQWVGFSDGTAWTKYINGRTYKTVLLDQAEFAKITTNPEVIKS